MSAVETDDHEDDCAPNPHPEASGCLEGQSREAGVPLIASGDS